MNTLTRRFIIAALAMLSLGLTSTARAQEWPSKPIKMVVTFAVGGGADFVGRAIGAKLSESLGQSVVVENRVGGGGLVGNDAIAKSAPDGYSFLLGAAGPLTVAPHLYKKVGYDTLKDLVPVALIASTPFVLVVHPSVPANTVAELTSLAKSSPDKFNYGSSGTGGAPHLAGELYTLTAGVKMVHAPYKGLAPAINDLIGGHIQVLFADVGLVLPHIKSGKLKALAVTSSERSELLPELPTVQEAGLKGYKAGSWYGILAPSGTPAAIVARINRDVQTALGQADFQKQLVNQGMVAAPTTSEQFASLMHDDYDRWAKLIKDANIKID